MTKGEKIKSLRKELGITQVELAKRIGVSKQTLYKYENDIITNIPSPKIELIASALQTSEGYIMGWKPKTKSYEGARIPVLGKAPCGKPIEAMEYEDTDDWVEIEESLAKTGEYYAIRAKGDSMLPRINDGDIMIIHQQEDVESGQVAVIRINGHEATCKKIKKYRDGIELIPLNPSYQPVFFSDEDIDKLPVNIMGRVMEVRSKL